MRIPAIPATCFAAATQGGHLRGHCHARVDGSLGVTAKAALASALIMAAFVYYEVDSNQQATVATLAQLLQSLTRFGRPQ